MADHRHDGRPARTEAPGSVDRAARGPDEPEPAVAAVLDGTDRAIIEALRQDGRRAYGAIAAVVGLSEAAVRRRVQRLRETGVVQIVAVTDPARLGLHRQALVGIRVEGDGRRVAAALEQLRGVERVVLCAGSFDLLVEVACEDDTHLLELLNDSVRSVEGVRSTETFLYLGPGGGEPTPRRGGGLTTA